MLYIAIFIVELLTLAISGTATLSLCTGLYLLMISFIEDATNDLTRLNVDKKSKTYDFDVKIRFHTAVRAYSVLKELSLYFP